jgi:hypothetical protein
VVGIFRGVSSVFSGIRDFFSGSGNEDDTGSGSDVTLTEDELEYFRGEYYEARELFFEMLYERMPIAIQVIELIKELADILRSAEEDEAPVFEFEWRGAEMSINFEVLTPYLNVFHGVIIALVYWRFIWYLYKKIPEIIGG